MRTRDDLAQLRQHVLGFRLERALSAFQRHGLIAVFVGRLLPGLRSIISIPAGMAAPDEGGNEMPVGFQIAAPAFAEQKLVEAAHALEQDIGFDLSRGRI